MILYADLSSLVLNMHDGHSFRRGFEWWSTPFLGPGEENPFQKLSQLEDNIFCFLLHFANAHIILFPLLHSHNFVEGLPAILYPENIASAGKYGFIMGEFSVQPEFIDMKF